MMNQMQQSLNQIAQICNQLSQNEQANVSKLNQMQEAERSAAQQLRQAAQLCQQVTSQMSQLASQQQFSGAGQYAYSPTTQGAYGGGQNWSQSHWSNRPISASVTPNPSLFQGSTQSYTGGYGGNYSVTGQQATGQNVFNTNKDLNS